MSKILKTVTIGGIVGLEAVCVTEGQDIPDDLNVEVRAKLVECGAIVDTPTDAPAVVPDEAVETKIDAPAVEVKAE